MLAKNMGLAGVQSDRFSTAIPLLADPDDIDPSSIISDITKISQAKDLKLSEKGEAVEFFTAAGGNHRTEALKRVKDKLAQEIQKLDTKHTKEKKRAKGTPKSDEKLVDLKKQVKSLCAKDATLGMWTVVLYDSSKFTWLIL